MMDRRRFLQAAGGAGLAMVAWSGFRGAEAAEGGCWVAGRVHAAGRPLAGVLVSDGRRVVRTNARGEYRLHVDPASSGPFVFVTTPRGYWTERFYVPTLTAAKTGRADFALVPVDQPDRFDFAFLTDMHLGKRGVSITKFRATLEEINRRRPKPAFLWLQGDICLQAGVGREYCQCLKLAEMPVRHGAGNHEMMLEHPDPRDDFHRLLGPTYYSFDWGPIHAVVLDGNKPLPGQRGWKAVHGAVEGRELEWLAADLAAQPPDKPIIVGVHIPIVSSYPQRRGHSPEDAPYWEMTNAETLTGLLSHHRVRLVLQGHMHENERTVVDGVEYVESISVSGSWWQSGAEFERGVDGSPRGYRIVSVDGTRVWHRYCSTCESRVDRPGEFYGLSRPPRGGPPDNWTSSGGADSGIDSLGVPQPLVPSRQTAFIFNCYDAPNGSTAEARIDDGPWVAMPAYMPLSRTTPDLKMPHHFRLLADTTGLTAGWHRIEARVRWPDGTLVHHASRFVVGLRQQNKHSGGNARHEAATVNPLDPAGRTAPAPGLLAKRKSYICPPEPWLD